MLADAGMQSLIFHTYQPLGRESQYYRGSCGGDYAD
jgi:hypothetical protein